MTELVERVNIQACESRLCGVEVSKMTNDQGKVLGIVFKSEDSVIIDCILKILEDRHQDAEPLWIDFYSGDALKTSMAAQYRAMWKRAVKGVTGAGMDDFPDDDNDDDNYDE